MRRTILAAALLASLLVASGASSQPNSQIASPAGQIYVVSINASQNKVIGTQRFQMLLNLAKTLLARPTAFNGGSSGAGSAPDVIVLQEISPSNLDILEKLLQQRSSFQYDVAGSVNSRAKFLINADRVSVDGEPVLWEDPCYSTVSVNNHEQSASQPARVYQWNRFIESETSTPFVVAGVHLSRKYAETGEPRCLERNVEELRRQLEPVAALPTLIAGDFNRKSTEPPAQCDRNELGAPLEWWSMMSTPPSGVAYQDTVREWHRARRLSMLHQWTHVHRLHHPSCGAEYIQHRIDYIFGANVSIAAASADHPGWAGPRPPQRSKTNPHYSDHRFVAGRYQIAGPPRAVRPVATQLVGGRISLSWALPELPPAEWVVFRAIGQQPYRSLARVAGTKTSYEDDATEHGRNYRYALAAIDTAGAQGIESPAAWMRADARGPRVIGTTPAAGAGAVERRIDIYARFNEKIDPASVNGSTIDLYRKGRNVCGRVLHIKPGVVMLDPCRPLGKRQTYRAVVRPVRDHFGNRGAAYSWSFVTR